VINITDKLSGAGFGRADLQLLDFLAMQIALNYRRIELYERFRSILKRSEELKNELGKSNQETTKLRRQIIAHERLATVGKMAGGIAHEFNNPLDGVLRYTNLCLKQVGDDEVIHSYLLEIKNGLNRMTTIVRNLLACSRRSEKPLQMIRPDVVVDQAIQAVQSEAQHKNVRIEKEVGPGLPDLKDLGLESILVNLLRNAVDALKPGGLVKISAVHLEHNGHVVFQVADNGPGIPDSDDPSKIFEPFYTTKDMEKGCGLGLTIVSEIVKSYQGQIQVESAPGEGATFIVTIPIETRDL
jgi:signal transduction histidine kinase